MLFQFVWSSKKEKVKRTAITDIWNMVYHDDGFTELSKGFENKMDINDRLNKSANMQIPGTVQKRWSILFLILIARLLMLSR